VGADAVAGAEGNTAAPRSRAACPNGLVPRSRRGRRARHAREGSPGTWEAQPSPPPRGGTAKRRKTKRGGMDGGESEHLIVPMKRGNCPEGPRGGKEVPGHGTAGGKDDGYTGIR